MVCFITVIAYGFEQPYAQSGANVLALLCQVCCALAAGLFSLNLSLARSLRLPSPHGCCFPLTYV